MNKSDVGRSSMRSVKSAASTANKSANVQSKFLLKTCFLPLILTEKCFILGAKEAELAMWRKRASYDPMKAAAEGKKKQDIARRSSQQSKYCDNRCESFAFFYVLCYIYIDILRRVPPLKKSEN